MVRRLALRLVEHLRLLTDEIDELTAEITVRVTTIAPSLLAIVGCGTERGKDYRGNSPRRPVPLQRRLRSAGVWACAVPAPARAAAASSPAAISFFIRLAKTCLGDAHEIVGVVVAEVADVVINLTGHLVV